MSDSRALETESSGMIMVEVMERQIAKRCIREGVKDGYQLILER